jgi:hypothetical protein
MSMILLIGFCILIFFFPVMIGKALFQFITGTIMLAMRILGALLSALFLARQKASKPKPSVINL